MNGYGFYLIKKNKRVYEIYGIRSCTVVASGSKNKMLKLLNELQILSSNNPLTKKELEDRFLYGE